MGELSVTGNASKLSANTKSPVSAAITSPTIHRFADKPDDASYRIAPPDNARNTAMAETNIRWVSRLTSALGSGVTTPLELVFSGRPLLTNPNEDT